MFVLMGMLLTQSLCWARLERGSGGRYQDGALSKMFYHGLKCWDYLLTASALIVMRRFNITSGVLVLDDTDRGRSKNTTRIWGTHKTVLKGTGGFHHAQNIVLLMLVTAEITVPVGAQFYRPDPVLREWHKQEKKLSKKGLTKAGGRRQRAEGSISGRFRLATNRKPLTFGLAGVLNPKARKAIGLLNR